MKKQGLKELKCSKYRLVVDDNDVVKVFNCKSGCSVDLLDLPGDFCDEWNGGVADDGARAFAKDSTLLTAENAKHLELKYKTFLPTSPTQFLSASQSVTVMKDAIYLTTQNASAFSMIGGNFTGYYVVAIRRKDGKILWQKTVSDYTGNPYDASRGTPSVHGDYLWIPCGFVFAGVQSTVDPDDPTKDLELKFLGGAPVKGFGTRNTTILCVNRHTGDLVWKKAYGNVAKNWNDTDNFKAWGFDGKIIPDVDLTGNGDKVPVYVIGSNYVGQYFWSSFLLQNRPNGNLVGASVQRRLRPYIDQGSLSFIHGLTGDLIVETKLGPRNLNAGEKINMPGDLDYNPIRDPFIPGHTDVKVRLNIKEGPLVPGDRFNVDGGNWTCVTLNKAAADLGVSEFKDTVPEICDGLIASDNTGVLVKLTAGETVLANPKYHEMNIRVNIVWVPGFEGDKFTVVGHSDPTKQFSVSQNLIGLRITKRLLSQDVLTADEAYELRYAGPSAWNGPVAYIRDSNGRPVEAYLTTGQGQRVPYDESLFFDSNYSTEVPPKSNYNDRQQTIADAVLTADISKIRAAEENSVSLCRQTAALADTAISPRGRMFLFDSIVAFNLRPGNLGKILWHERTLGYDTWQVPTSQQTTPNIGSARSAGIANGFVEAAHFWEQPSGLDGDLGQRCCIVKGKHGKKDKIVWASKQGLAGVIEISDVNLGPSVQSVKIFRYLGSASTLGGANYGSAVDDHKLYTVQRNVSGDNYRPLPNSTNFYTPYAYYPRINDITPTPNPLVKWDLGDQYVSAMNIETGEIEWEVLLAPGTKGLLTRNTALSCAPGVIFGIGADKKFKVFDSSNGALIKEFDQNIGSSWAGIADNEVYVWMGRGLGGNTEQYFKVYSLPKHILKHKHHKCHKHRKHNCHKCDKH